MEQFKPPVVFLSKKEIVVIDCQVPKSIDCFEREPNKFSAVKKKLLDVLYLYLEF